MLDQLRRKAAKQGFLISKKRGEDWYMIIDARSNGVVCGTNSGIAYDMTIGDVKDFLNGCYYD